MAGKERCMLPRSHAVILAAVFLAAVVCGQTTNNVVGVIQPPPPTAGHYSPVGNFVIQLPAQSAVKLTIEMFYVFGGRIFLPEEMVVVVDGGTIVPANHITNLTSWCIPVQELLFVTPELSGDPHLFQLAAKIPADYWGKLPIIYAWKATVIAAKGKSILVDFGVNLNDNPVLHPATTPPDMVVSILPGQETTVPISPIAFLPGWKLNQVRIYNAGGSNVTLLGMTLRFSDPRTIKRVWLSDQKTGKILSNIVPPTKDGTARLALLSSKNVNPWNWETFDVHTDIDVSLTGHMPAGLAPFYFSDFLMLGSRTNYVLPAPGVDGVAPLGWWVTN